MAAPDERQCKLVRQLTTVMSYEVTCTGKRK
jgi:hypothetical protein